MSNTQQILIMGINEQIRYIRNNFEKKYAENIANGIYDARDVEKLKNNSTFVHTFIRSQEHLDEAIDLLHSSLKFRKEMKVNDLHEDMLEREFLEQGGLYFHNRDINGHRILWLKIKVHRKDAPADRLAKEKMALVFLIEKAFTESPLHQIVVLLDMTSCGLINLDIDYVKYIINIFKMYYPTFLDCMLFYDMPWIFNAAWKVIRAWLNAETAALMKFVTKADIQSYIKAADLPPHMSGLDTFEYVYTPDMASQPLYKDNDITKSDKKVHFREAQEHSLNSSSARTSISSSDSESSKVDRSTKQPVDQHPLTQNQNNNGNVNNNATGKRSLMTVRSQSSSSNSTFVGRLLTVSPADELVFQQQATGDSYDTITLTNTLPHPVAFKVKTTSPEKFKVRPSSGLIKPERTEEIRVNLVSEHSEDVSKEKFLIMAIDTRGKSADLHQLFKEAASDTIMQHKLRCSLGVQEDLQDKTRVSSNIRTSVENPLVFKVKLLELQTIRMQRQINILLVVQILTASILILVMMSYACFGKNFFSHFLSLPFDFFNKSSGHRP